MSWACMLSPLTVGQLNLGSLTQIPLHQLTCPCVDLVAPSLALGLQGACSSAFLR